MRASGRPTLLMGFPPNISQGKPHGVMVGWFSQAGGRHRTRGRRHGPAAAQRRSAPHSAGSYLTLTFHRVPSDIGVIRRERACNARKDRFNRQAKPDLCGWALDSAPRPIRRRFQAGWWGYLCQVVRAPRPSSCRSVLACRACRPRERRLRDLQGPDTSKAVVTLAPRPALPSAARILIIALTTDTHTCAPHDCQRLAYDCIHTPNSISSMPIRNPFRRGPGGVDVHDENQRPSARGQSEDTGFQRAKTTGSKPVEILEKEYKLSEINDSGVFLPPSPTEKSTFWGGKSRTSTSSNHRSVLSDNEPFSISRESFDSYRRSFDISARAPVIENLDIRPRQSLDSRRLPRSSLNERRFERPISTTEEDFEDVGLNDEPPKQKKKGFFARFGDSSENLSKPDSRPASGLGFHLVGGRKRGQSGQGAELSPMPRSMDGMHQVSVESK